MVKQASNRLYEFHKSLYEEALQEASAHAPLEAPSVLAYSKEFYRSLPKSYKRTAIKTIIKKAMESNILLYGDFHTHRQTQKGLLRILEEYLEEDSDRPIILTMEMFRAKDQKHINDFLNDSITEDQFLSKCSYKKYWGFPWENYRLLIDFAKEHKIQIVGINTDEAGQDRLPKRDLFASKIINQIFDHFPESLCVCLIGEYHLADSHLPAYIDKKLNMMRILTNIDEFYFRRENYEEYSKTEYLSLKPNLFCVLNSPPWIKWRSYTIWEERKSTEEGYDPSILYTEESFDIDYQIVSLIGHLTEFLGISLKSSQKSDFHSYCDLEKKEILQLENHKSISPYTKSILPHRLSIDGFFYVPETKFALLNKQSLNSLAELAGQILYCNIQDNQSFQKPIDFFIHRVIMISAGVLASKTLNPRRKCPDIHHFETDLRRLHRKKLSKGDKIYRDALRYSVRLYYRLLSGQSRLNSSLIEKDISSNGIFSLMIGQILGIETYNAIMNPKKSHVNFIDLFQFSNFKKEIKQQYKSLVKFVFS